VRHSALWDGLLHNNYAVCPVTQDTGLSKSAHLGKLVESISEFGAPHTVQSVTHAHGMNLTVTVGKGYL